MDHLEEKALDPVKNNISCAESTTLSTDYLKTAKSYKAAAENFVLKNQIFDAVKSYQEAGNYFNISRDYPNAASAFSRVAYLYGLLNNIVKKREFYECAGKIYERNGLNREAAYNFQLAAHACLLGSQFGSAGGFYERAANLMQYHSPNKIAFIYENYLNSALAYAGCGKEGEYKESYSHFKNAINKKEYDPKDNFYFDKLIKTLTDNGLDDLAGEVYVEKMNLKVKNQKGISKLIYWIWGRTSDYGENWLKWMLYSIGAILFYSILYLPSPWGTGFIELNMSRGFEYPALAPEHFLENMIRSISFSVTVFSTLGFGDVTPANWLADLVIISEVLLGYGFLAVFITLISRKLMRR